MSARWPDRLGSEADRTERWAGWLDDDVDDLFGPPEHKLLVLRRIDLWSALKVSLVLYFCLFLVFVTIGTGLWVLARYTGALASFEHLMAQLGFDGFHLKDGEILRATAIIGPILVVLASLATVAGVALFNVVSRLVGGVEVTVSGDTGAGL